MMKYFILFLISLNVNAQTIAMPNLSDIKSFFNDNSSEAKSQPTKKYNFISTSSGKKDGAFLLFCYTDSGLEIPRFSNLELVAWQGKFLATDVETVDGKFIRVPSDRCFIESIVKKK